MRRKENINCFAHGGKENETFLHLLDLLQLPLTKKSFSLLTWKSAHEKRRRNEKLEEWRFSLFNFMSNSQKNVDFENFLIKAQALLFLIFFILSFFFIIIALASSSCLIIKIEWMKDIPKFSSQKRSLQWSLRSDFYKLRLFRRILFYKFKKIESV